jgi:hypothetical protein
MINGDLFHRPRSDVLVWYLGRVMAGWSAFFLDFVLGQMLSDLNYRG